MGQKAKGMKGKDVFVTDQRLITDQYGKFRMVIHEDDFVCPKSEHRSEWCSYVTIDYCESFGGGDGCLHIEKCSAYRKAKFGAVDDVIIDEKVLNDA